MIIEPKLRAAHNCSPYMVMNDMRMVLDFMQTLVLRQIENYFRLVSDMKVVEGKRDWRRRRRRGGMIAFKYL